MARHQLAASSSGISTNLNHGLRAVIENTIGNVVGGKLSNIANNYFPAQSVSTGVSTTNHESGTEISSNIGNVEDSTMSNIANNYSNTLDQPQLPVSAVVRSKIGDIKNSTMSNIANSNPNNQNLLASVFSYFIG